MWSRVRSQSRRENTSTDLALFNYVVQHMDYVLNIENLILCTRLFAPYTSTRRTEAHAFSVKERKHDQTAIEVGCSPHPDRWTGHPYTWLDPEIPGDASVDIDWYIRYARLAEEAKFDLVFIVDSQFITADSPPHYLNRLEPLTLLSALAVATEHIGLVGTRPPRSISPSIWRADSDLSI